MVLENSIFENMHVAYTNDIVNEKSIYYFLRSFLSQCNLVILLSVCLKYSLGSKYRCRWIAGQLEGPGEFLNQNYRFVGNYDKNLPTGSGRLVLLVICLNANGSFQAQSLI